MKKLTVAISAVAASVLMAMSAQAAEIYNKDSNKLDLYGKVNAKHYFSSNDADDGDTTYARLGFKGETQINDQLTGFGQWEYEFKGNRAESQGSSKDKTRLAFAGLKFGDYGSIDYGRNYGVAYDIGAWTDVLPEFGGDKRCSHYASCLSRSSWNSQLCGIVRWQPIFIAQASTLHRKTYISPVSRSEVWRNDWIVVISPVTTSTRSLVS